MKAKIRLMQNSQLYNAKIIGNLLKHHNKWFRVNSGRLTMSNNELDVEEYVLEYINSI